MFNFHLYPDTDAMITFLHYHHYNSLENERNYTVNYISNKLAATTITNSSNESNKRCNFLTGHCPHGVLIKPEVSIRGAIAQ